MVENIFLLNFGIRSIKIWKCVLLIPNLRPHWYWVLAGLRCFRKICITYKYFGPIIFIVFPFFSKISGHQMSKGAISCKFRTSGDCYIFGWWENISFLLNFGFLSIKVWKWCTMQRAGKVSQVIICTNNFASIFSYFIRIFALTTILNAATAFFI